MLLYVERPAPEQEPRPTLMIDGIRAAGTVSHPVFATPRELERLLADDLATSFSENFASAAGVAMADLPGNAGLSRMRQRLQPFRDADLRRTGIARGRVLGKPHAAGLSVTSCD